MKKTIALLIAVLMLAAIPAAAFASSNDTITVQIGEEPANLDMTENTTLVATAVGQNLNDNLVTCKDGQVVPQIAEKWDWNEDYTAVTFTLKDYAKFSDGTPITAEDVAYSFKLIGDKKIKMASTYALIENIEVIDELHLTIKLSQPYTALLNNMCDPGFCVLSKAALEGGMDLAKGGTVVSGPYMVSEWKTGSSITLTANENYYEGPAAIKNVKFLFMPDENNSIVALESGEIDYITGNSFALGGTSVEYLKSGWGTQLIEYSSTNYTYMVINETLDFFKDVNVRKAINLAINRSDVIAVNLDGYGTPAELPIIPSIGGYVEGYPATEQNIEKAKEYMAASAYPNGFKFQLNVPIASFMKAAQVMQDELKQIGIEMVLFETDVGTQVTYNASNNYEAFLWSFGNSTGDVAGISLIYEPDGAKNYARFTDPTINDAFNAANACAGEERLEALKVAYEAILDQCHYIALYFPTSYQAANENLVFTGSSLSATGLPLFYNISWK